MKRTHHQRGLTIIEVIVVVVGALIVGAIMLPLLATPRCGSRQLRDSTQIRGILQAMTIWAGNNNGNFPLPSLIDRDNATVPEIGPAKDTTANMLSILVNNGSISTELIINPAEVNGNIRQFEHYEFNSPRAAADPEHALWDPALSADFTNGKTANNSYAQAYPPRPGEGRAKWESISNVSATDAVFGDRGPEVSSVAYNKSGTPAPVFRLGTESLTNLIHGGRKTWEGNIAFADGHSDFLTSPVAGTYTTGDGSKRGDVLFFDEPDAALSENNFLGIFTKAGASRADFVSIWD